MSKRLPGWTPTKDPVLSAIEAQTKDIVAAIELNTRAVVAHAGTVTAMQKAQQDTMKRIGEGLKRSPMEFTIKRDERDMIKSVVARPTTILGE